ncbi:ferredoxin reductase [Acinetobacter baumannii]|uniref:ferredoxin reductase n=1 Tax=Acinetobacter baumannii TaxID=470 RepID=UPI0003558507|nr:ferredoxin reductase [Acinetobacter baumannii]AGQ07492.1 Flavodoxin reductases (ferredoxin-NADPH reductases) family 1 [Acinetobacter baumannii BJAB0715]AMN02435.1 oxidoreductase [Acinetobacter baumannii]MDB0264536.1 ferredoxin reductase [Acinetobacter baumannii]MDB0305428.1 ferredoxin reductase [Acinetobacter baumannii]MDC4404934.1 ferredoxin reductase [Acinetobacter baumannii]
MQAIEKRNSLFNSLTQAVFDKNMANFWLQKINPLWSVQHGLVQIVKKEFVAHDTVSLTLKCNRLVKMGAAGQHHRVIVEIAGRRYERTYSLTQIDAEHLRLTVKKVADGIVSNWFIAESKIGDVFELGQPYGDMQQNIQTPKLIMLAAGSGITPMLSLITAIKQSQQLEKTQVQLLYWVKQRSDAAFTEYFEQVAEQNPNFSYQVFYTQETPNDERLNAEHLALVDGIENSTVYACGPSGFVSTVEQLFEKAPTVLTEAFSLINESSVDDIGYVNVTLTQSNKVIAIPKGQSILVSLEHEGLKPTHGCRMGICNKCVCSKTQGSTRNLLNGSQNTEPSQLLKICVNSAQSDLVIDL